MCDLHLIPFTFDCPPVRGSCHIRLNTNACDRWTGGSRPTCEEHIGEKAMCGRW